ncbi:MAG: hypothetical protein ACKO7V_09235 [Bacteroidota bacterium]
MPSTLKTLLLDGDAVARKLTRIALQIREDNFDETRILLAGVKNRGLELCGSTPKVWGLPCAPWPAGPGIPCAMPPG